MTLREFYFHSIVVPIVLTVVIIISAAILFPPYCKTWDGENGHYVCVERN